ncbi:hypothetical protein HN51_057209 [Arachis hypogaea]|uniref:uncharacterized protein n=2 Tax=Arachis TaxID=3817 RepID=UPI000DEDF1AE|nr:uncharacterized protein LOC112784657 [Arachis hypogaea]QHN80324.1 Exocyst complex component [Arachis hypogaea]
MSTHNATRDGNRPNSLETLVRNGVPMKNHDSWWILYGFGAIIGIAFFPASSNLKHLMGGSKQVLWKIIVFVIVCVPVVVLPFVLHRWKSRRVNDSPNRRRVNDSPYRSQIKACGVFGALLLIYVYTFFSSQGEEREQEHHNKTPKSKLAYGSVSLFGFALMALALSIQTNYEFVKELMDFFVELLVVELTKIKWYYGFLGALFSFLLLIFQSCKEPSERGIPISAADFQQTPSRISNSTLSRRYTRTDSSSLNPEEDHAGGGIDSNTASLSGDTTRDSSPLSLPEDHAGRDVHHDPIDSNTTPLFPDTRTDSSLLSPTQDRIIGALNEKDQELAGKLRSGLSTYINGYTEEIPKPIMEDTNFIKDTIKQAVEALRTIVTGITANDEGVEEWLETKYKSSRIQFLLMCKSKLEPDKEATVSVIKKWIKHCNIAFKILIPNERVMCEEIFGESSPISERCFMHFCCHVKQDILSFVQDDMPTLMNSPEITLVFTTVRDLIVPEFQSLFPNNPSMTAEVFDLPRTIGTKIRDHYFRDDDFPPQIDKSTSCEVHPITMKVMHRLGTAFENRDNIEPILKAYHSDKVRVFRGRSWITNYIYWNVKEYEASLEATFNSAYDYELRGVSIMANVNYILKKAYDFRFELTEEDDWVKDQAWKIQRCRNQYWDKQAELLGFLKQHNENATQASVKKMLFSFGENMFLDNNTYANDEELELSMVESFIPNCESLVKIFCALLNGNQETEIDDTEWQSFEDESQDDETPLLRVRGSSIASS